MSNSETILIALVLPLLGAVGIGVAGRWPNLRETVTLATAAVLAPTACEHSASVTLESWRKSSV